MWKNPPLNAELSMPKPNEFLPEDVSLKPGLEELKGKKLYPERIHSDDNLLVYYKRDNTFSLPRADFRFLIATPDIYDVHACC